MIARIFRPLLLLALGGALASCGATGGVLGTPPSVYDLTERPASFAGQDVTVIGTYLWKPGNPSTAVLLPGVSTSVDGVNDAQPIYASVTCDAQNACQRSDQIGEPATGAIWIDNFPADVTANLHRPLDSVWGPVEVTGRFEIGNFGPDGSYRYRLDVKQARASQAIERNTAALEQKPLGDGKVSFFDLADRPAEFVGKPLTTQAYYFWSPTTSGLLVEKVISEQAAGNPAGINPRPDGRIVALDGFPPDLSQALNVGEGNSYVWGLVELTGTLETGGQWGPSGEYDKHFVIDNGKVQILGK